MADEPIVFRAHALQRMFERGINTEDVRGVIQSGETIEDYPDDFPYPSRLIPGWRDSRPIHVVAATNPAVKTIVITVYEPDPKQRSVDMRTRIQALSVSSASTATPGPASRH